MIMLILYSTPSGNFILHIFNHLAQMKYLPLLFYVQVCKAQYICF